VLTSRIHALFRRYSNGKEVSEKSKVTTIGDLQIDREQYLIYQGGQKISLPRKEFELLSLIASKPGKVFTRDEILERVWGSDIIVGDRTIDVHIRKLREKLGEEHIKTVKGIGYKFDF
jgi:two-component system alkaline phosphatase synthesis response regulator PhoP